MISASIKPLSGEIVNRHIRHSASFKAGYDRRNRFDSAGSRSSKKKV